MIFVGIDPGKHGAVAWTDSERKLIEVHDCPLTGDGFDFASMDVLIANAMAECRGDGIRAVIEDTISVPHFDARSGSRFLPASDKTLHLSLGAWLALLGARHIPTEMVQPKTWKRTMLANVPNDKRAEGKALTQRFQGHAICTQLHGPRGGLLDGRVDALWLAEYGRVTWKLSGRRAA